MAKLEGVKPNAETEIDYDSIPGAPGKDCTSFLRFQCQLSLPRKEQESHVKRGYK